MRASLHSQIFWGILIVHLLLYFLEIQFIDVSLTSGSKIFVFLRSTYHFFAIFSLFPLWTTTKVFSKFFVSLSIVTFYKTGFPTRTKVKRRYWMNESTDHISGGRGKTLLPELFKFHISSSEYMRIIYSQ